jgi:environmental stress-induced protein Ves
MSGIKVLRVADRTASPWKNGDGTTYQIAAFPPESGLADFQWRVSTAEVATPGTFSSFPGIDRILMVIDGALEVTIDDSPGVRLASSSAGLSFTGYQRVWGSPIGGTATDLNVMTRRGRYTAKMAPLDAQNGMLLIFADTTVVLVAQTETSWSFGNNTGTLAPRDAIMIEVQESGCSAFAFSGCLYRIELNRC